MRKSRTKKGRVSTAASLRFLGSAKRSSVIINPRMPLPNDEAGWAFLPNKAIATLYYTENLVINSFAGTYSLMEMSVNGLFDPNITHIGHQPRGFDQYMSFFDHYIVLESKCKFTYIGPKDGVLVNIPFRLLAGIGIQKVIDGAVLDLNTSAYPLYVALDERGVKTQLITPSFKPANANGNATYPRGGRSTDGPSFTLKWNLKKSKKDLVIANPSEADVTDMTLWQGIQGANPFHPNDEGQRFQIALIPEQHGDTLPHSHWKCEIAYKVQFMDRKRVAPS